MSLIIKTALKYEGFDSMKYQSPDIGNKPPIFDCSGFFQWVLLESGIAIPNVPGSDTRIRHTHEFFDFFGILVHAQVRMPGDAIFLSKNGVRPTHIGIYLGDGKMIHCPGVEDRVVEVRSLDEFLKSKPLKFQDNGNPQLYVKNPIGYKRAAIPRNDKYQELLP